MKGLSFSCIPFADLAAPLLPALDALYWDTSFQQSPFPWDWRESNANWLEAALLEVPAVSSYPATLWRPGTLSTLAPVLELDEWSQLTGFSADEDNLAEIVAGFRALIPGRAEYFSWLEQAQGIYIVWVDGWWEVYTPRQEWLDKLSERYQGIEITSSNFGSNRFDGSSCTPRK